jgi:hypothetical protein
MIWLETRNCTECGEPAVFWQGHVEVGSELAVTVLAGWCRTCHRRSGEARLPRYGYRGTWQPWHGINDVSFTPSPTPNPKEAPCPSPSAATGTRPSKS